MRRCPSVSLMSQARKPRRPTKGWNCRAKSDSRWKVSRAPGFSSSREKAGRPSQKDSKSRYSGWTHSSFWQKAAMLSRSVMP